MNEPQSVAAEKIALTILAGEMEGRAKCSPSDLISISYSDTTLWPIGPFSSVALGRVPEGQSLIITYLSLYTTLADESETAVNFGFNFSTYCTLQIQGASGNFTAATGSILTQEIFNKPILLLFEPTTIGRVILNPSSSTQTAGSIRVNFEATGYLIPAGLASAFRDHQTRFN